MTEEKTCLRRQGNLSIQYFSKIYYKIYLNDMNKLKLAESYVKVTDMDKSVLFYEELLQVKSIVRYKDRWTTIIDGFGLYRPMYDQ